MHRQKLFVASCVSLVTTSMVFAIRGDVAPAMSAAFQLTNEQMGLIFSPAFWAFTVAIFISGALVDVVGMRALHVLSAFAIAALALERRVPVLQHIWQHRRRDWPGQEASDAVELCALARRHPDVAFILGHIGGGGDWLHSLHAVADVPNVYVDLSGSGVDGGMLEACLENVGVERLLWGTDLTMDTGWAKLRYLETLLSKDEMALVRWKNAARIFPAGAFPAD